jgi:cell pole-organizing protein PopZ
MANPGTVHEPSMEEILASIRQIISEDSDGPLALRGERRSSQRGPAGAASGDEPLAVERGDDDPESPDFSEEPMRPHMSEGAARGNPYGPGSLGESSERQVGHESTARTLMTPRSAEDHLMSEDSDTAVAGAFSALAHTILAQNARTLEDLVTEMLKPMLKGWLDDNLPNLVERLVKEEIERVSRGRR